jgi:DNA gyrase/topoisomerase IV subunit A
MQIIEDQEGEITPEVETALQLTSDNFNEKALSYGLVVKHFDDEATVIEKEIERLSRLLAQAKKRKELFKQTLCDAMQQFSVEKIETPTLKLSFRKSESIELTDESKVPFSYVEEKVIKTISKTKIKEDIKQGIQVPGAQLVTKQNLQIK